MNAEYTRPAHRVAAGEVIAFGLAEVAVKEVHPSPYRAGDVMFVLEDGDRVTYGPTETVTLVFS